MIPISSSETVVEAAAKAAATSAAAALAFGNFVETIPQDNENEL